MILTENDLRAIFSAFHIEKITFDNEKKCVVLECAIAPSITTVPK